MCIRDRSKIHALIDSVRGYCYTEPNDEDIYANRAESLVYKPVFSEDDIKSNTEKSIIVKEDAFDDYLALVDLSLIHICGKIISRMVSRFS